MPSTNHLIGPRPCGSIRPLSRPSGGGGEFAEPLRSATDARRPSRCDVSGWKAAERRIARLFGGQRTGPTGRDDNDITHPLLAVEVKYRRSLPKWALECLQQARSGRSAAGKTPVTVMLGRGMRVGDGLLVVRVADFEELFGELQSSTGASQQ